MNKPPRNGDEALAQALDVTPATAAQLRRKAEPGDGFIELDAELRATAALADLDAARSLTSADIDDAASRPDPEAALGEELEKRAEQSMQARMAAHTSWGNTKDRSARTAPGRRALDEKFLLEADGDPVRAEHIRKAYYLRLALKSAQSRRAKKRASNEEDSDV